MAENGTLSEEVLVDKCCVKNDKTNVLIYDKGTLSEEVVEKKFRNFMCLLYEDTTSYDFKEVLRIIKSHKYYAYIKHHPESGEKKVHYHVLLKFDNATKKSTLAKKLGIPENHIDIVKNKRSSIRYLIHKDDDDKFQYQKSDVFLSKPFEREFNLSFDDLKSESDIIDDILSFIDRVKQQSGDYYQNLRNLILFVNVNCYDTIYKRYRTEFLENLKNN